MKKIKLIASIVFIAAVVTILGHFLLILISREPQFVAISIIYIMIVRRIWKHRPRKQ